MSCECRLADVCFSLVGAGAGGSFDVLSRTVPGIASVFRSYLNFKHLLLLIEGVKTAISFVSKSFPAC